ncbi:hypothetical protein, variant 6 [Aphanomyces astaci]|uniref:Uncharacterized protein n=1 Tax=Aphanomyces astaci TaxID=112090 RepID=W4FVZ9_APHAT|nr:hypothetical protein, variant 6 [Aphanomyces astaci]ETV70833.1 hypothetical protein, variant 6 [Aphanomyces astaci]|eukprot:XP_009839495.1 hypothetical protein, variant 6 [Aphanomyces astaci]
MVSKYLYKYVLSNPISIFIYSSIPMLVNTIDPAGTRPSCQVDYRPSPERVHWQPSVVETRRTSERFPSSAERSRTSGGRDPSQRTPFMISGTKYVILILVSSASLNSKSR